jgi:hypothetical protein
VIPSEEESNFRFRRQSFFCLLAAVPTLISDWVQEQVLHQTLIEVPSRLRQDCSEKNFPLRPTNDTVPSCRPIQYVGLSRNAHQLVPGSGEGQNLTNMALL